MQTFTVVFLSALLLTVFTRIWLASRHIRYVRTHRDRVPDNFSSQINLDAHQKAADYTCAKTRLSYINIMLDAVLLLVLTFGGGLNILADFWSNWFGDSLAHGMALILSTILLMGVIEVPINYYRTFVIEEEFGFNKMTPTMFFADLVKQAFLGALLGVPLLVCVLWLMEEMGANWWLYVWFMWMAFNLIILSIYPTWISPLFNKFTPLDDVLLKTRIEQLMQKCGFKSSGL
ncbi:MAG: M48 family peptidase, partial [Nitrosomonadaceae bacterium]